MAERTRVRPRSWRGRATPRPQHDIVFCDQYIMHLSGRAQPVLAERNDQPRASRVEPWTWREHSTEKPCRELDVA